MNLYETVKSSGVSGIKKTQLKKEFGKDYESEISKLVGKDKVIVDQKGLAHFVWTREHYLSHLSKNDPKYKIIFNKVKELEKKLEAIKNATLGHSEQTGSKTDKADEFKTCFNHALQESSSSIGWTQFLELRTRVCKLMSIDKENFYALANELVKRFPNEYEISTGGSEGITSRGLLHGYVRRL